MNKENVKIIAIKRILKNINAYQYLKCDVNGNIREWKKVTDEQMYQIVKFIKFLIKNNAMAEYCYECKLFRQRGYYNGLVLPMASPINFLKLAFIWSEAQTKINWKQLNTQWQAIYEK